MTPLTDILIAKIVLGYLSSRKLKETSDCFLKESEALNINTSVDNKGRILNQLEDQNLLPSLEEILDDYFAYQETDDATSDKTYMLWKQLDVILSQLRGIALGKKKSKAFLKARRFGNGFNNFVSSRKVENGKTSPELFKPISNEFGNHGNSNEHFLAKIDQQQFENISQQNSKEYGTSLVNVPSLLPHQKQSPKKSEPGAFNPMVTPRKEQLKTAIITEFKSPKRKSLHPKRRSNSRLDQTVDSTPSNQADEPNSGSAGVSPLLNEEFTHIVETLIGNHFLQEKLADNINKVVSSDGNQTDIVEKDPIKVNEVVKLTADDPDFGSLFAMLGDLNHGDDIDKQNYFFPSKETLHMQQQHGLFNASEKIDNNSFDELSSHLTFSNQPCINDGFYHRDVASVDMLSNAVSSIQSSIPMKTIDAVALHATTADSHPKQYLCKSNPVLETMAGNSNSIETSPIPATLCNIPPVEGVADSNVSVTKNSLFSSASYAAQNNNNNNNITSVEIMSDSANLVQTVSHVGQSEAIPHHIVSTMQSQNVQTAVQTQIESNTLSAPSQLITTSNGHAMHQQRSFLSLLNDDSNLFPPSNSTSDHFNIRSDGKKDVVRNLHNEISICTQINTLQSNTNNINSIPSEQLSFPASLINEQLCHPTRITNEKPNHSVSVTNEQLNQSASKNEQSQFCRSLKNMFQTQDLYLQVSSSDSPSTHCVKTPRKISLDEENFHQTKEKRDEDSVSIATDALLLLSTSPAKFESKAVFRTFSPAQESENHTQNVQGTNPLIEPSIAVSNVDQCHATVNSLNVTVTDNAVSSREILVSDEHALSRIPYPSDNETKHVAKEKNKIEFFEQPYKHITNSLPILPRPVVKLPDMQYSISQGETVSAKNYIEHKNLSLADQLAQRCDFVSTKKKRAGKKVKKKEVVTKMFDFGSVKTSIPSGVVPTHYIPYVNNAACNSSICPVSINNNPIITKVTPSQKILSRLKQNEISTTPQIIPMKHSSSTLPRTLTRPHNSFNVFRIAGGSIASLSPQKTTKSYALKDSETKKLSVTFSNQQRSSILKKGRSLTRSLSSVSKTQQDLNCNETLTTNRKNQTLLSPKKANYTLLRSPKKNKHNKSELKVKFPFKSPKKKHVHFFDDSPVESYLTPITTRTITSHTTSSNTHHQSHLIVSPIQTSSRSSSDTLNPTKEDIDIDKLITQGEDNIEIIVTSGDNELDLIGSTENKKVSTVECNDTESGCITSRNVLNDRTIKETNSSCQEKQKDRQKKRKHPDSQDSSKLKKKLKRKSSLESLISLGADRFLAKVKI
ncbi:uncharacterized protein LOC130644867 isoform X2 [Hydractinia symbiolongicarpus]|uniref:uncharacterized protein LOC130644867 isoform X2 n=1 Tax=Hydractinia symbiolongicarpus TaxID=13093 RepID=UPI002550E423|nr:uncharacterized protein LOC130644867 isoform X2 [Hydractinia symbiolongicarpus]